jgi:hypothetical protein
MTAIVLLSAFALWGFVAVHLLAAFSGARNAARMLRLAAWRAEAFADGLDGFSAAYEAALESRGLSPEARR